MGHIHSLSPNIISSFLQAGRSPPPNPDPSHSLTPSLSHSLSHSLTPSLSQSLTLIRSLSLSHSLTLSLSHTLAVSLSHALTLAHSRSLILSLSHSLTLSLSLALSLSLTLSHTHTPQPPTPQTPNPKHSKRSRCCLARVKQGVDRFSNVPLNVWQLLSDSNCLKVPQKWIFCTIFFRWTNHFQHSGVVDLRTSVKSH